MTLKRNGRAAGLRPDRKLVISFCLFFHFHSHGELPVVRSAPWVHRNKIYNLTKLHEKHLHPLAILALPNRAKAFYAVVEMIRWITGVAEPYEPIHFLGVRFAGQLIRGAFQDLY